MMGFSAVKAAAARPRMLLVASLKDNEIDSSGRQLKGADSLLVTAPDVTSGIKALGNISHSLANIPCGLRLDDVREKEIKELTAAGCDFVVLPANGASLIVSRDKELGKIIEMDPFITEGLLRTADELPLDAVLIGDDAEKSNAITWARLMSFQRFNSAISKYLLAPVSAGVTATELQAVWAAGIDGIVVEMNQDVSQDRLKELNRILGSLDLPPQPRRLRRGVLVPRVQMEPPAAEEEEDGDEEED